MKEKKLTVIRRPDGGYDLWMGGRLAENLCFDEMLGTVASVMMTPWVQDIHERWFEDVDAETKAAQDLDFQA